MSKDQYLHLRVRATEKARWTACAEELGVSLTDWVRAGLQDRTNLQEGIRAKLLEKKELPAEPVPSSPEPPSLNLRRLFR